MVLLHILLQNTEHVSRRPGMGVEIPWGEGHGDRGTRNGIAFVSFINMNNRWKNKSEHDSSSPPP